MEPISLEGMDTSQPISMERTAGPTTGGAGWLYTMFSFSMRGKAIVAVIGMLAYALGLSGFVMVKKERLFEESQHIQRITSAEQDMREMRISAFHTLLAVQEAQDLAMPNAVFDQAQIDFHLIQSAFKSFISRVDKRSELSMTLGNILITASSSLAIGNAKAFTHQLKRLVQEVEIGSARLRREVQERSLAHRMESDSLAGMAFGMGVLGVILFGTTAGLFFHRLAGDLNLLKAKAQEIVRGRRGRPLRVSRQDEVGQLMAAVNQMQSELARQEEELAIERQKVLHQERMAAIGTLATGIAHEIGNPITAISGIAQQMCVERDQRNCTSHQSTCRPDLILEQADRIARITRDVSEFSSPRNAELGWLDLNQLVRNTASLLRYDKRFRNLDLSLELDSQLPALIGVSDHLIQITMNLLLNAADALEGVEGRDPRILVTTLAVPEGVQIAVSDNGKGMDEATRKQATEVFFTTKPLGKGTGLGLALCASFAKKYLGRLEIESQPDIGTTIRLTLPLDQTEAAQA